MMIRRAEALAVSYYIVDPDVEVTAQIRREEQGSSQLSSVIEDIRVLKSRVLDTDGCPVETHCVSTTSADVDQLEDPTAGGNDEVSADVRQLMKLRVRNVWCERIENAGYRGGLGNVLDDHMRVAQSPLRSTVVTQRVGRHLMLAFQPKRDQVLDDVRPLRQPAEPILISVRVRSPNRPNGTQQGKRHDVHALASGRLDGGDRTAA